MKSPVRRAGRNRGRSKVGLYLAAVGGLLATVLSVNALAAPNDPLSIELNASIRFDGTTFADDPADLGDGSGAHTPGLDDNGLNNVVKTFDRFGLTLDWNTNDQGTTNQVITATLPLGTHWTPDPNYPPFKGCRTDGVPASSLSTDQRTLICNVGSPAEGTNGQIRPIAIVEPSADENQLVDDDGIEISVSMVSDQHPTPIVETLDLTVSSRPAWNWVKHTAEVVPGVDRNGVPGSLFIYPLTFTPAAGSKIGSEPIDDDVAISFYDHALDLAPSAVAAEPALMGGRTACGGYDGAGAFPYGNAALGTPANTTAGAEAGSEVISCSLITSNPYPTVKIDISGHDTSAIATSNADGSPNKAGIAAQVAFWMPDSEMLAKAEPSDGVPDNGTGTASFQNAISATATAIQPTDYPDAAAVAPVQIAGAGGSFDEATTGDDSVWNGTSFAGGGTITGGPGGGAYLEHRVRFLNGMQLAQNVNVDPNTGTNATFMDTRNPVVGGLGTTSFSARSYAQNGTVARSQDAVLELSLQASGNIADEPVHGCMRWENQHLSVKPLTGSIRQHGINGDVPGSWVSGPASAITPDPSPWAHVLAGQGHTKNTDPYTALRLTDGVIPFGSLGIDVEYVVEFAHVNSSNTDQEMNHTTCNEGDADVRGWASTDEVATVFPVDADGLSTDINAVRIRTLTPVPWYNTGSGPLDLGTQITLAVPVKVGSSLSNDPDGTRIRLHSSRAWGAWNPATTPAPPTPTCGSAGNGSLDLALNDGDTTGWCNRPYASAGEYSEPPADGYETNIDPNAFAHRPPADSGRLVHSDMLTIVAARLALDKSVVTPTGLIADNGDLVEFSLKPSTVGSPQDTLTNVVLIDRHPVPLRFESATPAPDSFDADGHPIWNFGDRAGGWTGPEIRVRYRVAGTSGDTSIVNQADLTADNAAMVNGFAQLFTPPIAARSEVVKSTVASLGECPMYPDGTAALPWFEAQCERYRIGQPVTWNLNVTNDGNRHLGQYAIIDVFPFDADAGAGDTRTPASNLAGRLRFGSITVDTPFPHSVYYSKDAPGSISRDPATSRTNNTWCDAPTGGIAVFGTQANCPTSVDEITAVYVVTESLRVGSQLNAALTLQPVDAACDDVYTNNFGGRTAGISLPVRSNDETVMVDCTYDLALLKDTDPTWAAGADWLTPGTSTVDYNIRVVNQGDPVEDFDVVDYLNPAVFGPLSAAANPTGMTTGDAALPFTWDLTDPQNPVAKVDGVLGAGKSVTIPVTATIAAAWDGQRLLNTAEISRFDNNGDPSDGDSSPTNTSNPVTGALVDIDSTPDKLNTDPMVDGVIDGSNGDEDDHDPAELAYMNLGIEKRFEQTAATTQMPLRPGGTAGFSLTLTNKGTMPAVNPELTDVVDLTMFDAFEAALNPGGSTTGSQVMPFTWAAAGTDGVATLTGTLLPGQSVQLPVTLRIAEDAVLTELVNHVEITGITGPPGTTPGTDKDTDETDNTDDAPVHYLDMELTKTVTYGADTTVIPPKPGETITFGLHVKNAGTTHVKDPTIIDYVDTTMWDAFDIVDNPAGSVTVDGTEFGYRWTANGVNGALAISGIVPPGATMTIPVTLRVAADADPMVLTNIAEITTETPVDKDGKPIVDKDGDPIEDWDSTPDSTNTDPPEEDDHDQVSVSWYDVGVLKEVAYSAPTTQLPIRAGGTVTFDLAVTNFGNTRALDVELLDVVNLAMWDGFELALNPAGTTTGAHEFPYAWSAAGTDGRVKISGILEPGETVHLPVTLTVAEGADDKDAVNVVRVVGGKPVDKDGKPITDEDGDPLPDSDPDNNTDDAVVPPRPVFDLALEKTLDPAENKMPITPGGQAVFTITVTNEGSVKGVDIEVTDYLPPQLVLNDPEWTDNGDGTASRPLGVDLEPGASASVTIRFDVPKGLDERVVNVAEISKAIPVDKDDKPIIDTTTGKPIPDEDSTPDRDDSNDPDGEDDIDDAEFTVDYYDLALEKVVSAATPAVLKKGDIITYDFNVTNEGTLPVHGFVMVDSLPGGLVLARSDANGWVARADGTLELKVDAVIQPGDTFVAHMDVQVMSSTPGYLTNHAEIEELFGPDGEPVIDWDEETGDDISEATVEVGAPSVPRPQEVVRPDPASPPPSSLPVTGTQVAGLLSIAALSTGLGLVLLRRRRHNRW